MDLSKISSPLLLAIGGVIGSVLTGVVTHYLTKYTDKILGDLSARQKQVNEKKRLRFEEDVQMALVDTDGIVIIYLRQLGAWISAGVFISAALVVLALRASLIGMVVVLILISFGIALSSISDRFGRIADEAKRRRNAEKTASG